MKRSDLIREELASAKENAKKVLANGKSTLDEINAATINIDTLQAKLNLALKEEEEMKAKHQGIPLPDNSTGIDPKAYEDAFINSLRGKATIEQQMTIQAALSSTADADGGLLIPKDQETKVIELAREYSSLRDEVTVEPVNTLTGSRVIEQDAEYTAFTEVTEGTKISDMDNGQFKAISYNCKTYGGLLPIPMNLLKDNTGNLLNHIDKWFARKKVATENKIIIDKINTLSKSDITSATAIDDIKKTLNVTLDPKISDSASIITNQTGFNALDKLKDTDGRYLLQPDPTQPTKKMIKGRPVKVYPDKILPNDSSTKAPILIGDLKRAITLFDRQLLTVDSTAIGAGAFEKNTTMVRGLMRLDAQKFDEKAVVFLQLETAE